MDLEMVQWSSLCRGLAIALRAALRHMAIWDWVSINYYLFSFPSRRRQFLIPSPQSLIPNPLQTHDR